MTSGIQRFIRDVGWSFASLALSAVAHFILRIFLARYLGADELGLYSLSFAAYSFGLALAGFGLGAGLIKYAANYKSDNSKLSALLASGCIVSVVTGLLMGLILYLCSPLLADSLFHMPGMTSLLRIVAFSFPFIALQKATLGFLNGLRRMRVFAAVNIVQNVLVVSLTVILAVTGYGVEGAVAALVAPVVLMSLLSLYPVHSFISRQDFARHKAAVKALMIFSLFMVIANIISTTQGQIDTVVLGHYMTEAEVGYYSAALVVAMGLRLPPSAIQMVTAPMLAEYWEKGEVPAIESMVNRTMKLTAVFMAPLVFLVVFFAEELSRAVFGDSFALAGRPLQILMAGTFIASVYTSIGTVLSSTAFVSMLFKLGCLTLVFNIVMTIVLIPHFGIAGAAAANSAAAVAAVLLALYITQRLVKIKIDWWWFIKLLTFCVILTGATYGLGIIINIYICICIAFAVLLAVLFKCFLTRADLKMLYGILPWR